MNLNPFKALGGLASDAVETVKAIATEVSEIPQAIADGYNEGCIINNEPEPELTKAQKAAKTRAANKAAKEAE